MEILVIPDLLVKVDGMVKHQIPVQRVILDLLEILVIPDLLVLQV
jgi:hypothetical protein